MDDQNIEEAHIMTYVNLVRNNYLGVDISEKQDDILAKVLYKKLPKNTGMAKLFTERTTQEIGSGLDTVPKAVFRLKSVLAMVRQSIRIATSYGPISYDFKIDHQDKEITNHSYSSSSSSSSSSTNVPPSAESKRINKRSAADCEPPTTPPIKCECCGGYGHSTTICRWYNHPLANITQKSFANSPAASIWRTICFRQLQIKDVAPTDPLANVAPTYPLAEIRRS